MFYPLRFIHLIFGAIYLICNHNICGQSELDHEKNTGSITYVTIPPSIDGEMDSIWEVAEVHRMDNLIDGEISGPKDLSAVWRGLWTSTHFYLFVEVVDDKKLMDSPGHSYLDDQIELFVTTDNKKPKDYFNPPNTNTFAYENPRTEKSFESHKRRTGHVEVKKETTTGWILEMAIPFTDWNIDPKEGHAIGIDVQVNDDDEGGDNGSRDAKIAWNSLTDVDGGVAFNPLLQGTAIFLGDPPQKK